MNRKKLTREVGAVDRRLTERRSRMHEKSAQAVTSLRQHSALMLIIGGLVAGFTTRRLGVRRIYSIGKTGFRWGSTGLKALQLSSFAVPMLSRRNSGDS